VSASPISASGLLDFYTSKSSEIRSNFAAHADGTAAVKGRAALVDDIVVRLWRELVEPANSGAALAAIGGYGRGVLFPCSDIDLLFLCPDDRTERALKPAIAQLCQQLWDLRVRVSPMTRSLAECERVVDGNLEFTISLLDCRFLAGDEALYARLHDEVIPRLIAREGDQVIRNLAEITKERHEKFGGTVFHLEPNLKEGPGGLRDYNVACWLTLIRHLQRGPQHAPRAGAEQHKQWPSSSAAAEDAQQAFAFLADTRCFMHFRDERDHNVLHYEAQPEAAAAGVGNGGVKLKTSEWSRAYFRHARTIHRWTSQLLDDIPPAKSSLYRSFGNWRARLSNAEFSVVDERVFVKRPTELVNPALVLSLFEFVARHGFKLSAEAERRVQDVATTVEFDPSTVWPRLREILGLPQAANALRAMHSTGILLRILPEYAAIDSLVIRDFFHRYTVDEHTFTAIGLVHGLAKADSDIDRRYAGLLAEVDRLPALVCALLFHDVGKGMPGEHHSEQSLVALDAAAARLGIDPDELELIRYLVGAHMDMSTVLRRRDIFDLQTVRGFAETVGSPERLKMLTLMTYADYKAVSPEALPAWRADHLWQLYVAAANALDRTVDEQRFHSDRAKSEQIERVLSIAAAGATREEVKTFLEGLPRRYLLSRPAAEIAQHFSMAARMSDDPVQVRLTRSRQLHEITVVAHDRPGLFATIAGVLAAWGMNIIKADAFANRAGTVLDRFAFTDTYRTLELNPEESGRFQRSMRDVVAGEISLERLIQGRIRAEAERPAKMKVKTSLTFDQEASSHSTLVELITQDRPGLLYNIASVISEIGHNIELALIDTEGQKVVDVFYLTRGGAKLTAEEQEQLRAALMEEL
jgi:[protein-PII] uridylyltransferase